LGLTYDDAYARIRAVRKFINPQASQVKRLKELEAFYSKWNK